MAQRQVDDIDPEEAAIRHGELNGADDIARAPAARRIEHLQPHELDFGSHALHRPVGETLRATDETCDVRPVAVVVVRQAPPDAAAREVEERLDSAREGGRRVDARVDERDGHPLPGGAPGGQPHGREGRVAGDRVVLAEEGERRAGRDHRIDGAPVRRGAAAHGVELGSREIHRQGVDGLVLGSNLFASRSELLLQPCAIPRPGLHNHPRRTTFTLRLGQGSVEARGGGLPERQCGQQGEPAQQRNRGGATCEHNRYRPDIEQGAGQLHAGAESTGNSCTRMQLCDSSSS